MRFLESKVIVGVVSFVVFQFSNLGMAGEFQGRSDEDHLVKQPAVTSQSSLDGKPDISIQEFVRQPFPSPLTFFYFEKIREYVQDRNTVPTLIKLLKDACKEKIIDERLCSNIVITLGVLASPEALSGIREFLNQGSQESNLKVMTDAIRALGVWANIRNKILEGQGENAKESGELIKSVLRELVKRTGEGLKKTESSDIQIGSPSPSHGDGAKESGASNGVAFSENLLKGLKEDDQGKWSRRLRRAAIQSLALSGSNEILQLDNESKGLEVKEYLEGLLARAEVGTSFRAFMLEILTAHNIIARVGVECYFEQEKDQERSEECRARWAGKENLVSQ